MANECSFWLCDIPGESRFSDSGKWSLDYIYGKLVSEDLLRIMFYDSSLFTLDMFKDWALDKACWFYAMYQAGTHEPLAFAAINGHVGRAAMLHYCIFSQGRPNGLDIAADFLKEASKAKDCLLGLTPKPFRHARHFAVKAGGKAIAEIPGACYLASKDQFVPGIVTQFNLQR